MTPLSKKAHLVTLIQNEAIKSVFQPIVSLSSGEILAYEVLSRPIEDHSVVIDELFKTARKNNLLWELEKLCRSKALYHASNQNISTHLFLNVDAQTIKSDQFKSGFTVETLLQYHLAPENIVIELTEQSAIKDSEGFIAAVNHYQEQGFRIAIDDFGSGYSGLGRVCALGPKFIKIDMNLVRNCHKESVKRLAISSTVDFCNQSNIKVIAEGIETQEELNALIGLGVDYGQGYLIGRPDEIIKPCDAAIVSCIKQLHERTFLRYKPSVFGRIFELGSQGLIVNESQSALEIYELLKKRQEVMEVIVIDQSNHVIGLVTRQVMFERFSGQYGYNLNRKNKVKEYINQDTLIVDEQVTIDQVAEIAMQRKPEHVYDPVIITRDGKYLSQVSVKDILLNSIQLQVARAHDANPLTGLPGNQEIQRVIGQTYRRETPWSIAYFDLDFFKAYNDAYGFHNGDLMLKTLAQLLIENAPSDSFIGHIGGDDFVVVSLTHDIDVQCQSIIKQFNEKIKPLYTSKDWKQKYIISKDRNGFTHHFSIATLSIAILTNQGKSFYSIEDISYEISQLKKKSKQQIGHAIIKN